MQARAALLEVLPEDRVVVVARHVGREQESLTVTTLGEFDPETVDMGCLVMIGAASTRVTDDLVGSGHRATSADTLGND